MIDYSANFIIIPRVTKDTPGSNEERPFHNGRSCLIDYCLCGKPKSIFYLDVIRYPRYLQFERCRHAVQYCKPEPHWLPTYSYIVVAPFRR